MTTRCQGGVGAQVWYLGCGVGGGVCTQIWGVPYISDDACHVPVPSPHHGQIDTCENITFLRIRLRAVIRIVESKTIILSLQKCKKGLYRREHCSVTYYTRCRVFDSINVKTDKEQFHWQLSLSDTHVIEWETKTISKTNWTMSIKCQAMPINRVFFI